MWEKKKGELLNVTKVQSHVMLVLPNVTIEPLNVRKKKRKEKKENYWCDKSTVTCDVGTAKFEDSTIKCEKKIWVQLNVAKVWSNVMLVLPNVTIEPSNVRKKIRGSSNVTKERSHVMLVLHNVRMVPSNMTKNKIK